MTIRNGHGAGAGVPRIEVLPVDELPRGVPSPADEVTAIASAERGPFTPGNRRSVLGGRAKVGETRLARKLGLAHLPDASAFAPYKRSAVAFRRAQCNQLARTVGGGMCGPAPSSMVASAALQLAWARYYSDQAALTGDRDLSALASRLSDASRQNLLASFELCAKEATARHQQRGPSAPWLQTRDSGHENASGRVEAKDRTDVQNVDARPGATQEEP